METPTRQQYKKWLDDSLIKIEELGKIPGADQLSYIHSIGTEIKYLQELETQNKSLSPEDAERINLGLIAVREIEDTDPAFAKMLESIDYWSRKI